MSETIEKQVKKEAPIKKDEAFLYEASELIKNANTALGVESYVASGALIGVDKISIKEAKVLVDKFLKKGVE